MAEKKDIGSNITLELNGIVTPNQLVKALNAFSSLLNGCHKFIAPEDKTKWIIQVKEGSNLVEFHHRDGNENVEAIRFLNNGIKQLFEGESRPTGFNDRMLKNIRDLSNISKKNTSIKIWLNKNAAEFSPPMKKIIETAIAGEFSEYSAIEGNIQLLNSRSKKIFHIYESLNQLKISCNPKNDEIFEQARELFDKRVSAEGMVKFNSKGIPYQILVDRFNVLPEGENYKETRGLLKKYV